MWRPAILFTLVLLFPEGVRADTVTLRRSAHLPIGRAVTLGDIADLTGADAASLSDVVIIADPAKRASGDARLEVSIDTVHTTLDQKHVNWGRLSMRGATCTVSLTGVRVVPDSPVVRHVKPSPRAAAPVDLTGPTTVRTRVALLLARLYNVKPDALRVLFQGSDEAFLNTLQLDRRIEIQPTATPSSSRSSVIVWIYDGDRLQSSRTLRLDLLVRRQVVVTTADIQRGESINAESLRQETRWIAPTGAPLISSIENAAGFVARRRLAAGVMLRSDLVELPIVVKRGELVTVHCVSGGVVVKAKARARAAARLDEVIELQLDGSKKTFRARIVGPGRAVVNLDQERGAGVEPHDPHTLQETG